MDNIKDKIKMAIEKEIAENQDYKYYFGVADTQGHDMKVIKGDTCEDIFNKLEVSYERIEYYREQEELEENEELTEENYKDFLTCYYDKHFYSILEDVSEEE